MTENNTIDNHTQERILKNTSSLTIAFVLQKILSFLYFIFIAKNLGPVDLGLYDPAKSLIPILLILIDFSLSVVLVREIARSPEKTTDYLNSVLGIKAIFAFLIILSMGLYTNFSEYSTMLKTILYLDAIVVTLDTFTLTFFAVFRGFQNMKFEAIGIFITQIITIIFGVISIKMNWGLQSLFIAVVAGSIFNFIFSFLMIRYKLNIKISLRIKKEILKKFLKIALPFAVSAILVKIYTYTDRFMLLKIVDQAAVGWYITAHKLTYALEFIPSAFAASIFPAMSAFFITSHENLKKTFETALYYLLLISFPIMIGIFILADKIILSLYGTVFETSILPLRILISGLVVIFLNFPVGAFLNACNRQIINTINMAIAVSINLALNYYLIKVKGISFHGAAISALVSGVVLFILGFIWVNKIIKIDLKKLFIKFIRILIPSLVMGGIIYFLSDYLSIYLLLVIAIISYICLSLISKSITKNDLIFIYNSTFKRLI